jgi:hypothetical protein
MKPHFFRSAQEWRAWLEDHHEVAAEFLVGFHKVATGKPTLTWSESVDHALCFGWIDGVRRRAPGASSKHSPAATGTPRPTGCSPRRRRKPASGASPSSSPTLAPAGGSDLCGDRRSP